MTKFYRTLSLSVGVAMLAAGCASGPQYKDVASSIPTLAADHGLADYREREPACVIEQT
ncbi:hypothetical protein [Paraburkholderia sp. SIMBA_027]|uniref:hypothetical protein n=1 Tax=Paraburkholderia sp. SIMBA_027 TaxID=3085770 RepID=UPI0039781893